MGKKHIVRASDPVLGIWIFVFACVSWWSKLLEKCNTYFGVCVSSKRFPSWNSWDLLRCSAVKPGSRWMSLRLGGGGVPGAFTLFLRRIGGVPGGVMVLTTKGVRGGVWPKCLWRGEGGRERWPVSKGGKPGLSTVSRSAYKGGAKAWGLWHMCWLYLDWTLGLWASWNRIHWLASGWHTGVFSLPDSEVGHWMDQSCFVWLPIGKETEIGWLNARKTTACKECRFTLIKKGHTFLLSCGCICK